MPRDGTLSTPDLWRVDAAAKRGERERALAEATYRDTLSTALAVILDTESQQQRLTAEAGERRYQELSSLDVAEIDRLWVKADLINRFAALGYPHESVAGTEAPMLLGEPSEPSTVQVVAETGTALDTAEPLGKARRWQRRGKFKDGADFLAKLRPTLVDRAREDPEHIRQEDIAEDLGCSAKTLRSWLDGRGGRYARTDWDAEVRAARRQAAESDVG